MANPSSRTKIKKEISHIALIMDGNGRWARSRGLPRYEGHAQGLRTLRKLLRDLKNLNISYLTLFTFSIDNWKRPKEETSKLMQLLRALTVNNTGLYLQVAFNYSGRQEIINATKKIAIASAKGEIDPNKIDNTVFESNLYSAGVPDPDLIIRTGSEKRVSNFLLWQLSYSEVYFEECLWPDFNKNKLDLAINDYNSRSRRFGNVINEYK